MSDRTIVSMRERKRAANMAATERVTVDLCLRHGVDNVTVQQICDAADISTSTFFNYFGTKEGAVIGRSPHPSDAAKKAFLNADGPLLSDLIGLPLTGAREAVGDVELFRRRIWLIDGTPRAQSAAGHPRQERSRFSTAARAVTAAALPSRPGPQPP